jgi:hypothetical protein
VNHGDFIEGYCFQIITKNKENKEIVWELCTNTKVIYLFILYLLRFFFKYRKLN